VDLHFIEASDATEFNWGKFAVGRFSDAEWSYPSAVDSPRLLLRSRGWSPAHVFVLDVQTGEGAMFLPGGSAAHDLGKHRIWVCPLFEPFLSWLYEQNLDDLSALPAHVKLGDVPTSMFGYRRAGPDER
jgi:hypothetical protein